MPVVRCRSVLSPFLVSVLRSPLMLAVFLRSRSRPTPGSLSIPTLFSAPPVLVLSSCPRCCAPVFALYFVSYPLCTRFSVSPRFSFSPPFCFSWLRLFYFSLFPQVVQLLTYYCVNFAEHT